MWVSHAFRQSRSRYLSSVTPKPTVLNTVSITTSPLTDTLNDARPRPRYSKRMGTYGGLYLSSIFRVVDGMMGSYRSLPRIRGEYRLETSAQS
ncbi:hypothetical protein CC2G_012520 [Coprinopsis cinerea AmutBmut pab1-1]|nr:hypothetical protein CC2G_012520 [Coprinopsis cinerea AmutBmut pab1-1]